MPIKIPDNLPARKILESENVFVMTEQRAATQDIRPLQILILNLMPTTVETETQLLRLLGNSPLQVDVDLLQTATHTSKNTAKEHLLEFYKTFDQIKHKKYDGMIITGAPVETMHFEDVDYWDELCEIMDWSTRHVYSTLHICWGAQAGLYHHYQIEKRLLDKKLSGIFTHRSLNPAHPLMRGFDETFRMPHSRYTELEDTVYDRANLEVLADSDEAGVAIVASADARQIFVTGHFEYDRMTLAGEYTRDVSRGIHPDVPQHYFPNDDATQTPAMCWSGHANLLYANWLNYFVYQQTTYDIETI